MKAYLACGQSISVLGCVIIVRCLLLLGGGTIIYMSRAELGVWHRDISTAGG